MRTESCADQARKSICNLSIDSSKKKKEKLVKLTNEERVLKFKQPTLLDIVVSVKENVAFLVRSIRLRVGRQ